MSPKELAEMCKEVFEKNESNWECGNAHDYIWASRSWDTFVTWTEKTDRYQVSLERLDGSEAEGESSSLKKALRRAKEQV